MLKRAWLASRKGKLANFEPAQVNERRNGAEEKDFGERKNFSGARFADEEK